MFGWVSWALWMVFQFHSERAE
uniref:Uncharacterized protein n=1 Tax=Anguilla anguilla TaxID=7936 RepID=A0A0E9VIA1_ANGAN